MAQGTMYMKARDPLLKGDLVACPRIVALSRATCDHPPKPLSRLPITALAFQSLPNHLPVFRPASQPPVCQRRHDLSSVS